MTQNSHADDVAFIQALAELLRENDLSELEVKREYGTDSALNVRVARSPATAPALVAPPAIPAQQDMPQPQAATSAETDPARHPGAVTSPMVGTVYLQPEPGAESFVTIGSTVKEGQTLLIVEAMKTMNQIAAPQAGTVTRILVDDGSPVEYGAPLLIIE